MARHQRRWKLSPYTHLSYMRSRLRLWLGNLALLLAGTVFALVLAEVALRMTGHRMVFPRMVVEDPHTVYRLKPNVQVRTIYRGYFDYEYTVNSQGLRAPADVVTPKPDSLQRLLFVGDSFTFGVGVDDSATYPARVDARLRRWCNRPLELVNAGVGGFGTSHELSFLRYYGWQLEPDIVVVGFLTSDPEDNSLNGLHRLIDGRLEEVPASQRPGWGLIKAHKHVPAYDLLVQHSTLFNWLRLKIGNLAAQRAAAREAARAVPPSTEGERGEPRELERWRLTAAIFERLRAQADSQDVPLIVAIIPHGGTLKEYYARGRDADVDRMLEICGEHRLRCVNVSESIRRSRPAINPLSLYLRDGHFSASGYDLVADAVARPLADQLNCTTR